MTNCRLRTAKFITTKRSIIIVSIYCLVFLKTNIVRTIIYIFYIASRRWNCWVNLWGRNDQVALNGQHLKVLKPLKTLSSARDFENVASTVQLSCARLVCEVCILCFGCQTCQPLAPLASAALFATT